MDREQAREVLNAHRPNGGDAKDAARFDEALAMCEQDAELAAWFAEQSALDEAMRNALAGVQPPADLRESILASAKVAKMSPARPRQPVWLAVAAGIVLLAGALVLLPSRGPARLPIAMLDGAIPRLTALHDHALEVPGANIAEVRRWLAANGGAADFAVPAGLQGAEAVACEIASVQGTAVTILCFNLGGGRTAHLYVVNRAQLESPPAEQTPGFRQLGEYALASWSQGERSYFLAEQGDAESLRRLL